MFKSLASSLAQKPFAAVLGASLAVPLVGTAIVAVASGNSGRTVEIFQDVRSQPLGHPGQGGGPLGWNGAPHSTSPIVTAEIRTLPDPAIAGAFFTLTASFSFQTEGGVDLDVALFDQWVKLDIGRVGIVVPSDPVLLGKNHEQSWQVKIDEDVAGFHPAHIHWTSGAADTPSQFEFPNPRIRLGLVAPKDTRGILARSADRLVDAGPLLGSLGVIVALITSFISCLLWFLGRNLNSAKSKATPKVDAAPHSVPESTPAPKPEK